MNHEVCYLLTEETDMTSRTISFIDLFCGIGGVRLGFESAGCKCVLSCDWDKYAQKTYEANFGENPIPDIRELRSDSIPKHDLLTAGFPCQPFSISGVSKKNSLGRPHGFEDKTQGTLFFEVARIIRDKRPKAFVLENVKNLLGHDKGRTIDVIYGVLQEDLGYHVLPPIVLDAKLVVPQHRERVFIVGFDQPRDFERPKIRDRRLRVSDILESNPDPKYTLSDHLWQYLQKYAEKHRAAGNGFGFGLVDLNGITRTLSARYYKDGSEILIPQRGKNPRRLTPRECARLMGFPEKFKIVVSDTQAYKQFGNSVVVPLVAALARQVVRALDSPVMDHFAIPMRPRQLALAPAV
ncbi:MAG: DNA (cytosine-5-)-methyltransferase [Negativicutes bacterium]|nr:DNA (cytosine-5-)-methyltransferase [Negativicutes bacterium]